MPSPLYVPILIAGMLITGSSNSLWSKWQRTAPIQIQQTVYCMNNRCGKPSKCFVRSPLTRSLAPIPDCPSPPAPVGEMLCFLPVIFTWARSRRQSQPLRLPSDSEEEPAAGAKPEIPLQQLHGWKVFLLWFPAACDLTGTTLMNVGLLYTPVSIYQMTRGALVLFVGILSVIFLRRRLWLYQLSPSKLPTHALPLSICPPGWISLITVMAGVSLVGLSGSLVKDAVKESALNLLDELPPAEHVEEPEVTKVLVGVFFILFAQIFTAAQFVTEEKIMNRYSVAPLVAVGYEGLFGALSIILAMPILAHFAYLSPFFDLPRGWHQMIDTPAVLWSGVVIAFSIALFNFFGLSVTRHVSATARSLTDTCRTLSIWVVSLGLGWEPSWDLAFTDQLTGLFENSADTVPSCLTVLFVPHASCARETGMSPAAPTEDEAETQTLLAEEALEDTSILPSELGRSGFDVVPPEEHAAHAHRHSRAPTASAGPLLAVDEGDLRV
ncbi:hypothetical protein BN946_scf184798.g38 [Trametes cinnabarina]|uniref:EamA domain-containing protein n=1 Tax=Pycnoporus cinnabarinus TaxID=5643 RepID=A0A060SEA7_PYCCI|nr:hypothetical protein BN946_scf184798.g38 [Trametes cinnabarina]